MNKTILIAAPIQNRAWILPHYLEHIKKINYPKNLIRIYWIVNNSQDATLLILRKFKEENKSEYLDIEIEIDDSPKVFEDKRETETREKYTYSFLSYLRNKMLKKTVKRKCDYLFSCDTDILVSPDIIKNLMAFNKSCVSSLIYNGYELFDEFWKFPNILKKDNQGGYTHIVNNYTSYPSKCPKDKLISTEFTGACFLAKGETCDKVEYRKMPQGEDQWWSEKMLESGYELWCSPYNFSKHIMSEKWLGKYLNNEYPIR
jgi:hypothetical protein